MTTIDGDARPVSDLTRPPRRARGRRRRGGPRWLDFSIAATALVVSTASLLVARHQAQVMDRQLAASVWPSVRPAASYNPDTSGGAVATLSLDNHGTGPALLRSFRVSYRGRPLRGVDDLLALCCTLDTAPGAPPIEVRGTTAVVVGRVLSPSEHLDFVALHFLLAQAPATARVSRTTQGLVRELTSRVCYCSVLDECWVSATGVPEPAPVPSCADEARAPQYR